MDLDAVRTFVAVVAEGRFADAADDLSITQQAVSKRIAGLEHDLGVRLFTRSARGATLTADGQVFLPHARELLRVADRARAAVAPGQRALRVDVLNRRIAPADLLRGFHRTHPSIELDVVTLFDADTAIAALRAGTIDVSFRAVAGPPRRLPADIDAVRVLDEPVQLLTGPDHEFATSDTIRPARLAGWRVWMPGNSAGTEWAAYYEALAAEFGCTIDTVGPNFGTEPMLEAIAGSATLCTFVGTLTRMVCPPGHELRRVALRHPTPVYPHSLVWRRDNAHPALATLREHLGSVCQAADAWTPNWSG